MKYRVEVVQTNVFYIEADSPEEAKAIATGDYIWDEDQTAPNSYGHEISLTPWADRWTKEIQEENAELDLGVGWDSCNETAWLELEWHFEDYNLEMRRG